MIRPNIALMCGALLCAHTVGATTAINEDALASAHTHTHTRIITLPSGTQLQYTAHAHEGHLVAEGDILLGPAPSEHEAATRGSGISIASSRWLDGIIPFQFDASITDSNLISRVHDAIDHWNDNSSIRLVERTDANADSYKDYVVFTDSDGCASYVGRNGGAQEIWVSASCNTGGIIHEVGHAIGLLHEHTRNDRDQHIVINYDNILEGKEHNFAIPSVNANDMGPYDYGSIMHYGAYFFSASGEPTISPIHDTTGITMGQRIALSAGDITAVDRLYQTDLSLVVDAPNNIQSNATFTVDVSVSNLGEMGANDVLVIVPIDAGTRLNTFEGDGWDCTQRADQILCGRATLIEYDQSRLSLSLTAGFEAPAHIAATLSSRTWDNDASSNGTALSAVILAEAHETFFDEPMVAAAASASTDDNAGTGALALVYLSLLSLLVFSRQPR
ncbi:MAG TPA: hypothetical protein DD979_09235 [Gammaproteobacteria bacterium]|jgi:astacin|nr:hypothetical protein [Gammaproteobacteria bacterium]